ncbi:MarR family winged helix-turn-helix transcriptional regulator [Actinopolymorpha pittospori]
MAGSQEDRPEASQDFGWALGTLFRAYHKAVGDAIAEIPGGPRGFQVLDSANSGVCQNQAAMADHLGIDRTAMTYLLDDLEAKGLVQRTPDPADRRSRRVTLTAEGTKTLKRLTVRVADVERHVLGGLQPDEAEQLRAILSRAALGTVGSDPNESACTIVESIDASA